MPLSAKAKGPDPGTLLTWQILAPVMAVFFLLVVFFGIAARQYFEPLAMQRDLLRAERYAKFAAVIFGERLPGKTPQEITEEFRAAGLEPLQFLQPGKHPAWTSPRFLTAGPYVEAWSPATDANGTEIGVIVLRRQADATLFVASAIRCFTLAACLSFLLLAALAWVLIKYRITARLRRIAEEHGLLANKSKRGADAVEEIGIALADQRAHRQRENESLRRLLDGHSELACVATPEGTIVDANAAYCRFFGKKRGDLIGTSCLDLVKPEYRMDVVRHLRSLSRDNPETTVTHALTKADGSTAWVKWHATTVQGPDGRTKEIISFRTDITPQIETEARFESLRRAFDQMQSLAETGSLTWDFAADQMEWTPETRRLLGVDMSAPASLNGLLAAIAPEERETMGRLFRKARDEGREFQKEFRAVLPDGSLRVLQSRAEVLADPKTKLLNHLTCTLRDITALRDAEAATKRELRVREAIEQSMGVGIVVSDEKGRNLLVNPAFARMTGWSQQELVGITAPYPYWPEEEIPEINKAFERAIAGKTPDAGFELRFCRRDGTRFDVLVKVAPLLDSNDKQLGWLGAVSDVSTIQQTRRELAETERQLRRQLNYLQAVEKSITVGLIAIGTDGRPLSVNDAYCRMLGYTREEIMAMSPPYPLWPEEDREEIEHAFGLHLKGEAPEGGFQLRFKRKDGSLIDVLITISNLRGEDGSSIGVLSSLANISPLKDAQRRLAVANERLKIAQDIAAFGIWDWDPAADTLYWDANSFAMFGHPETTDAQAVWKKAHSEEEQERLTYELRRLIEAGGASGQDRLSVLWPDGSRHEIVSTYVIIRNQKGEATRVIGVNRDITDELEEERELRNAQERLAAALEIGEFGTFEHVFGVGAINWNAVNYEIHGIDTSITNPDELFRAWKFAVGSDYQAIEQAVSSLPVEKNSITYDFSVRVPGSGESRRVRSSVFVERNSRGHPVRLVGVSHRID